MLPRLPAAPHSLGARLMLLMLLAALPAFVVIGYLAFWQRARHDEHTLQATLATARALAREHENNFDQARLLLSMLAHQPEVAPGADCQGLMEAVHAQTPRHVANLFLVAPDGQVRCSAVSPEKRYNVAGMPWFQGALKVDGARVGEYHVSRRSGQPTIVVTHTLGRDGAASAVLVAALDLSWLARQPTLAVLPAGAAYGIFDTRGQHLLRYPEPPGRALHDISATPLWREITRHPQAATFHGLDPQGHPRLFAATPLGPPQQPYAHLLVGIPAELAEAEALSIFHFGLLGLVVAMSLGLGLGWLGGWRLVLRPLAPIKDTLARLAAGELSARAGATAGVGEIARLAQSVDAMAQALEQRERDLQASRDLLREVLENMPGTAFRCEIAYPWRMEHISPSVRALTGLSAEAFLTGAVRYGELIHGDDLARVERAVAAGVAEGRVYACEYRVRHADGDWRWAYEQGRARYDADGTPRWLDGVIVDISERKRLEADKERLQAQLQQAQKMEALGQLTGGIAHDFNNILASVLGFAKLALRRHTPDPDGELAGHLREIIAAGERARDLVAKMLAFGRSQPGQGAASLAPLPLAEEAVRMLAAAIPASIRIHTRFDAGLPEVALDPVAFHQILMNLVINARDAVGERGEITVALASRRVEALECAACHGLFSGDYVELGVADTGAGMTPETRARIFEPFFTTKEVGRGTGMGLAMVHGLVNRAGGHFRVESTPGRGSAFHVYLPVAHPPAGEAATAPAPVPRDGVHVLLVDDDPASLRTLATGLAAAGWRSSAFASPAAALAAFRAAPERFAALVTDLDMPGMGGMELAAALREQRPGLPVLLCAGQGEAPPAGIADLPGPHSLYRKPVDTETLLATLADLDAAGRPPVPAVSRAPSPER